MALCCPGSLETPQTSQAAFLLWEPPSKTGRCYPAMVFQKVGALGEGREVETWEGLCVV